MTGTDQPRSEPADPAGGAPAGEAAAGEAAAGEAADAATTAPPAEPGQVIDAEEHRRLAAQLFNYVWTLMRRTDRDADADAEMVHAAHASRWHWSQVGGPEHAARGEWQCSRVYTVLGRAEPALFHAARVLDICQRHGIGDWDLAFAYEALARAHACAGDAAETARYLEQARAAAADITEDEDRAFLLEDLATIRI